MTTLMERQRQLGESDIQFARRLGVPRTTWSAAKNGHRRIGIDIARGAVRAFPDLKDDVVAHLLGHDDTIASDNATESTEGEDNHGN